MIYLHFKGRNQVLFIFNLMCFPLYLDGGMENCLIFKLSIQCEHFLVANCTRAGLKSSSSSCIFNFNCCAATAHHVFVLHFTVGILFWLHLFHCD